jgi:hypothetical protein
MERFQIKADGKGWRVYDTLRATLHSARIADKARAQRQADAMNARAHTPHAASQIVTTCPGCQAGRNGQTIDPTPVVDYDPTTGQPVWLLIGDKVYPVGPACAPGPEQAASLDRWAQAVTGADPKARDALVRALKNEGGR